MRKCANEAIRFVVYLIVLGIVFGVLIFAHFSYNVGWKENVVSYNMGWSYESEGKQIPVEDTKTYIKWQADKKLILKNTLPKLTEDTNVLGFRTSHQNVRVYVDRECIYSFGFENKEKIGKSSGNTWHYVRLPIDSDKCEINVELTSPYEDCSGYISEYMLGTQKSLMIHLLNDKMFELILSIGIFMYSLVMVVLYLLLSKYTKKSRGYIYLAWFCIFVSMWTFGETQLLQFVYPNTAVIGMFTCYCMMLMPVAFNLFISGTYYREKKRIYSVLTFVGYINIVVQTVLQLLDVRDLYEMLKYTHIVIFVVMSANVINVVMDYIRNKTKEARRLTLCFAVMGVTAAIDFYRYYYLKAEDYAFYFRIGILMFICLISFWYARKLLDYLKKGISASVYEKMAYEDALTGCKNRAFFEKEMNEVEKEKYKYSSIALIIFDLNDLKYHNDNMGHSVGDALIEKCAYCISSSFAGLGELARIGGDEFAMIIRDLPKEKLENAITIMEEKNEYYSEKEVYNINVAYGYAFYDNSVDENMESVYMRADKYMYDKKRKMKKKVFFNL